MPSGKPKDDFLRYKTEAVKAAEDFRYGRTAILAIEQASTSDEISKIMRECRIKKFRNEEGVSSDSLLVSRQGLNNCRTGYFGVIGCVKLG